MGAVGAMGSALAADAAVFIITTMQTQPLTVSRLRAFRMCGRNYEYKYLVGLVPNRESEALVTGRLFHQALHEIATGQSIDVAIESVWSYFGAAIEQAEDADEARALAIQDVTIRTLLHGYQWRWGNDPIQILASEKRAPRRPLTNPATGRTSRRWHLDGVIDKLIYYRGSEMVMEHKTTSQSIDSDSPYWRRLQLDAQISQYVIIARELGLEVQSVLYDVVRKPTIKPKTVALADGRDLKIVLDQGGERVLNKNGSPRQTGDTKLGYTLQVRPETAEEYAKRIAKDIEVNYDNYFRRIEVARTEDELKAHMADAWNDALAISDARKRGHFCRDTDRCITPLTNHRCPFLPICTAGTQSIDKANPPEGYHLGQQDPELTQQEDRDHGNNHNGATAAA